MLLLCNYYLTYRCNADCEFCHFGYSTSLNKTPHAEINDVISNIQQVAKLGVKFIDFTGGEPLLFRDIPLALFKAKELKMQTSITTNGLLYPRFAKEIKGKVDLLHFSLDSPDEKEHNSIRKVDCFKKVLESIEIAKQLKEHPDILFTVTNETVNKLDEMYKLACFYSLILIINPVFSYFGNPGLSNENIKVIEDFIKWKSNAYINPSFLKLRKDGGNNIKDPKCKAVSRVIVISPNNEILLPCYHMSNKMISINKPIAEIIKSSEYNSVKKMEGRYDFCAGCTINCYFEPSFAFPTNYYSMLSVSSKFKYIFSKIIKQKLLKL